ncbi:MAG: pilin [bacterium]|nr:pilin [bacterium]
MIARKTIIALSALSALAVASTAFAQGFVPLAPIPGLTDVQTATGMSATGFATFFNNLYKYCVGLSATLAVIMIIWGGLEYSTQDIPGAKQNGKEKIQNAIFGLVLVLSPVLVFSIINPRILSLSLNFTPINLTYTNTAPTGGGGARGAVDAATGCMVTGTLLKNASCPTQQAAQNFAAACSTGTGRVSASCQTVTSSGCADTSYKATCDTTSGAVTGPYVFLDESTAGFSFSGIFNTVAGRYKFEPLASTASNPNNGAAVMNFAATCSADGGTVCMNASFFSTACTFTSAQPSSQSNKCYSNTLSCVGETSSFSTDTCEKNPTFVVIQ